MDSQSTFLQRDRAWRRLPSNGRRSHPGRSIFTSTKRCSPVSPIPPRRRPHSRPDPRETTLPSNLLFMGSSVVSGTAKALVLATGRNAQLGSIASALQKPPPPTAFAVGIQKFGLMIVQAAVLLVLFVLLMNLLSHRPPVGSFLFALALAVGLTPELLPMIVSVTLSHGARCACRGSR